MMPHEHRARTSAYAPPYFNSLHTHTHTHVGGAACSWQTEGGWRSRRFFLGNNKEDFDAELYAIYQAIRALEARGQTGRRYTAFSDSQAAIRRAMHDGLGP